MISGIKVQDLDTAKEAAVVIKNKGVETVVITLGDQGALVFHENVFTHISAVPVDVLDTTSAGDVFNAALAVALSENRAMTEAVSFACKAAAISVTRLGAQASAPFRREVNF
jgi:ribokinase